MRDRRIDIQRLTRNPGTLLGRKMFECPHVVQAVRQLDQHHSNIVHHGQDHFAKVLGLLGFRGDELDPADFCDPFDNPRRRARCDADDEAGCCEGRSGR